jgi:hypothetical protein
MNGESPIRKVPVYVPLLQAQRSNGMFSLFVDQVAQNVASSYPGNARALARRMLNNGSLLMFIDDLDYLDRQGHGEIEEFIRKAKRNSFACIMREKPPYPFLDGFTKLINLRRWEWDSDTVGKYINNRTSDPNWMNGDGKDLIAHLEDLRILRHPLTPWQAAFLVDRYRDGTLFKFLELSDSEHSREFDYEWLDKYMDVILNGPGIERSKGIKILGRLALKSIELGLNNFTPEQAEVEQSLLSSLTPKLFLQQGNEFSFIHGNYQIFLAGRYIAEFWPEAKTLFQEAAARTLIWKPVFTCARRFMPENQIDDLEETFRKLAK